MNLDEPRVRAPEFPSGLEWVNGDGRPLTLQQLRGRVVLLDFWTYGCINCLHVIPEFRRLEQRFADDLVVIGVHSGKHIAERVTSRIRDAALRLEVHHPIVNDRQFRVWRSYAVRAWPTLAVVDPRGYVLGLHAGEFTSEMIAPVIERLLGSVPAGRGAGAAFGGAPGISAAAPPAVAPSVLRYPGKVAVDGSRIAIADSGHHRVIVGALTDGGRRMRVERTVGGPAAGFDDGDRATFDGPQGLVFGGDALYVADARNHAVRAVELPTGRVRTVAGTGQQIRTAADRASGALSSPWDLALVGDTLHIAMAGTHQLWAVRTDGWGLRVHAGTGGENVVDAALGDALLAQPMGVASDGERLYFADAESSAVRSADLAEGGEVRTIVGTGLFEFGDEDGVGDDVRLQHPQGVAVHPGGDRPSSDGGVRLVVADSYNDALRWVHPTSRRVETWVRGLHEPTGVAVGAGSVYVADTNAHRIAVVDERTGSVSALEIVP